MTRESIFEQYKRIQKELSEAPKKEPTMQELVRREEARLGVKLVPVPMKGEK